MAQPIGDTHSLELTNGTENVPTVPYASRCAGLYSEVTWDPITSLRARAARTADKDSARQPASPA